MSVIRRINVIDCAFCVAITGFLGRMTSNVFALYCIFYLFALSVLAFQIDYGMTNGIVIVNMTLSNLIKNENKTYYLITSCFFL